MKLQVSNYEKKIARISQFDKVEFEKDSNFSAIYSDDKVTGSATINGFHIFVRVMMNTWSMDDKSVENIILTANTLFPGSELIDGIWEDDSWKCDTGWLVIDVPYSNSTNTKVNSGINALDVLYNETNGTNDTAMCLKFVAKIEGETSENSLRGLMSTGYQNVNRSVKNMYFDVIAPNVDGVYECDDKCVGNSIIMSIHNEPKVFNRDIVFGGKCKITEWELIDITEVGGVKFPVIYSHDIIISKLDRTHPLIKTDGIGEFRIGKIKFEISKPRVVTEKLFKVIHSHVTGEIRDLWNCKNVKISTIIGKTVIGKVMNAYIGR